MPRLDEVALVRAEIVDATRTVVGYELRSAKRRILNEVEVDRLARFDAAVSAGEDINEVKDALLAEPVYVRAVTA